MSAASEHREGAFARWGHVCFHADDDCRGALQAMHFVSRQRLREERRKLILTPWRFAPDDRRHRLAETTLDALVADDRNSLVGCEHHHGRFDRLGLSHAAPGCVVEFARTYGIEHLVAPFLERDPMPERGDE